MARICANGWVGEHSATAILDRFKSVAATGQEFSQGVRAAVNATLLYRIAAVLFLVFAISHTIGLLSGKQPSPEVAAVRASMDSVRWRFMGSEITYGGIYVGFGLLVTASLLLSAF